MTISTEGDLPPGAVVGGSRAIAVALSVLAFAYLFVGAFPGSVTPGSALLDGAWVLEINRLAVGGFGRDLAFTYGPLGFLLYPSTLTSHVVLAALLRVGVLAALAAWAWSNGSAIDRIVFAVAQVGAVRLGLTFEYQILIPFLLFAARSLGEPSGEVARSVALASLAAAGVFVKFSLGAAFAAVVAVGWVVRLQRDRARSLRSLLASALAGAAVLLSISAMLLAHPSDLFAWIWRSLGQVSGYSEAMSLASPVPGSDAYVVVAAGALALLAGFAIWKAKTRSAVADAALLSALPAFIAFKHAFVRQDVWHTTLFFPLLLSIAAATALLATSRLERIVLRCLVAIAASLSFAVSTSYQLVDPQGKDLVRSLAGADGVSALRGWLSIEDRRTELTKVLKPFTPPGIAEVAAGRRLGVVPFLLGLCAAPDITCIPNPTLQTFTAYTPGLDEWSADHYLGSKAPPLVMLHLDGIDGRSPAFDSPALWRALVAAYRNAPVQVGGALLLERVPAPIRPALVDVDRTTVLAEHWVSIPDIREPRYASLDFRLTWTGRFLRTAYRVAPVFLSLRYASGEVVTIRLVPATARDGLPVDQLPLNPADLVSVFHGEALRRPVALAVFGVGLSSYQSPISLTWLSSARIR